MNATTTSPKIFITDYKSYNEGHQFQAGDWYNLTEFSDIEELYKEIEKRYKEANQPCKIEDLVLMITDFEGFPSSLYTEYFDPSVISEIIEMTKLDGFQREIIENFINCFSVDFETAKKYAEDAFFGEFESNEDFAENYAEMCDVEISNTWPHNCINWERAAAELMFDFSEFNGFYFSSNW